jgi:hypothetical protein
MPSGSRGNHLRPGRRDVEAVPLEVRLPSRRAHADGAWQDVELDVGPEREPHRGCAGIAGAVAEDDCVVRGERILELPGEPVEIGSAHDAGAATEVEAPVALRDLVRPGDDGVHR